jgi:hypothetical protein
MNDHKANLLLDSEIECFGKTLRQFFKSCVVGLWEDDSFNGKRPGEDSDWRWTIYDFIDKTLDLGLVERDEEGYIEDISEENEKNLDKIFYEIVKKAFEVKNERPKC